MRLITLRTTLKWQRFPFQVGHSHVFREVFVHLVLALDFEHKLLRPSPLDILYNLTKEQDPVRTCLCEYRGVYFSFNFHRYKKGLTIAKWVML